MDIIFGDIELHVSNAVLMLATFAYCAVVIVRGVMEREA